MRSIVTVAWSVCLSVGHNRAPCKTDAPIDIPFGLWTRVGQSKHKFSRIRPVALVCPHGRNLANTIEPFVYAAAMRPYVKLV